MGRRHFATSLRVSFFELRFYLRAVFNQERPDLPVPFGLLFRERSSRFLSELDAIVHFTLLLKTETRIHFDALVFGDFMEVAAAS